ncbi:hypothetical protein ILUMI_01422 [Ignelater luminosus]|uniref:Uncharacterized protein n=1 Tax=Ignelater luminosus TaxID=2038154 RepID=A0A8K0GKA3_IGNLU|nr:hypothetical protein ILUMI_01422 [Ignelater luminosus]
MELLMPKRRNSIKKQESFNVEDVFNPQNDCLYATKIENIPHNKKNVCQFQNKTTVMVWGAVSFNGVLSLVFVEKGIKINGRYYMDEILQKTSDSWSEYIVS